MKNAQWARTVTNAIKEAAESLSDLVLEAYDGKAWEILGRDSWNSYVDAEFDMGFIKIPREDRVKTVVALRQRGMSTRDIGNTLGVSKSQINRDTRRNTVPNGTVIIDRNGREHPATKPATRPLGGNDFDKRRGHLSAVESEPQTQAETPSLPINDGVVNMSVSKLSVSVRHAIEAADAATPITQSDWLTMASIAAEVDQLSRLVEKLIKRLA